MRVDHLLESVVHLRVDDLERESGHVVGGAYHREVQVALAEDLHYPYGPGAALVAAGEELRDLLDWSDGGGQADPHQIFPAYVLEALKRDG